MLLEFKTMDDSLFLVDIEFAKWNRIRRPYVDEKSEILESGETISQGFGIYNLKGRTVETTGPGAGLCTIGVVPLCMGTILNIYLRANVQIKEFTMPIPINTVMYEVAEPFAPLVQPTVHKQTRAVNISLDKID